MIKKASSAVIFLFVLTLFPVSASAGVPDWLRSAAQQPAKKYADDVDAVVLLDNQETTVKDNGEIVVHGIIVYRILRPEGKEVARYSAPYDKETKLNYLRGWSITAKGQEYEAKDKDAFEHSATTYEIYSDMKERILPVPGAEIGTVVGFEYEQKKRPYIFQSHWSFQYGLPVEHTRYELRLPSGWEYRADWINHPEITPQDRGGSYVWELNDVPRIEREYHRPPQGALAGSMVITFFSEKIRSQTYKSWHDFGIWYAQLAAGTREATPAMQQKVLEIAPADLPVLERITKLAHFAQQDIRYAEISIGIGGYRPHTAGETFTHRYGDCKDKATLLVTMLSQLNVKSYWLLVRTDRGIYTEKTPPMASFDHMILAIQLPDANFSRPLPAIYEHPKLGRLLIFDPTNDLVPFGELPYYEQDNFGLLVTDQGGELIHLPLSKPELNQLKRTAKLTLLPDGALKGEVQEIHTGTEAFRARATFGHDTETDRKKTLERILGHWVGSFQLDSVEADNLDNIDKELVIRYKFSAQHYAKSAGSLLLVRPRVLGEQLGDLDNTKQRHYAYSFDTPTLQTDTFEFSLPEGYKIDELPDAAKASFAFGEYSSKIESAGNSLKYSREYRINATSIPADRIGDLTKFFHQINADEKNMAVLKKAN
jgi:transglutaminase-like putative cysteine protease